MKNLRHIDFTSPDTLTCVCQNTGKGYFAAREGLCTCRVVVKSGL